MCFNVSLSFFAKNFSYRHLPAQISYNPEHHLYHAEDADASEQSKSASCEDDKDLDI